MIHNYPQVILKKDTPAFFSGFFQQSNRLRPSHLNQTKPYPFSHIKIGMIFYFAELHEVVVIDAAGS